MTNINAAGINVHLQTSLQVCHNQLANASVDANLSVVSNGLGSLQEMQVVRGHIGDMLLERCSVFDCVEKIAEPMQSLLHRSITLGEKGAIIFFTKLYQGLRTAMVESGVTCISFEKAMQSMFFLAMHAGMYKYVKHNRAPESWRIYTDNAEAVRILNCFNYLYPGELAARGVPKVRLAVSQSQVTRDYGDIMVCLEAVARSFRNLGEGVMGSVMSRDERRAMVGWLRSLAVLDSQRANKVMLEVCQDGYLRFFRRDMNKNGAPLHSAQNFELTLNAKTGKPVSGGCGLEEEAEFCACWRCMAGRGRTYGPGIQEGADFFRMVSFFIYLMFLPLCICGLTSLPHRAATRTRLAAPCGARGRRTSSAGWGALTAAW